MERLTEQGKTLSESDVFNNLDAFDMIDFNDMVYEKLSEYEDIMEKYGIESVKELDMCLDKTMLEWKNEVDKDFKDMLKEDRDTWKEACELMFENVKQWKVSYLPNIDYFYQQARKESK